MSDFLLFRTSHLIATSSGALILLHVIHTKYIYCRPLPEYREFRQYKARARILGSIIISTLYRGTPYTAEYIKD